MPDQQQQAPAPHHLPRIVKSARKFAAPRFDNPDIPLPRVVATKTAIDIRFGARPVHQELNERPVTNNHPARKAASHDTRLQTDIAPQPPRKVTFSFSDFPLPVERRTVARNRPGQDSGRLNPGFSSSGAQGKRTSFPSKSASFFPERSSTAGTGGQSTADGQRRHHDRRSANDALDKHRRTATKVQQIHTHGHAAAFSGKSARKFEGVCPRKPSLVPRMTSASRDVSRDNIVDSSSEHSDGSAYYIDADLTLSNMRMDKSDNDSDKFPRNNTVKEKAARKFQLGRKSKPAPPKIQHSDIPSSNESSEQSEDGYDGFAMPEPAHEDSEELEYVDLGIRSQNITREQAAASSESDVAEGNGKPAEMASDALIEALEDISLMTIRLARFHRLPFMLRNLREGFLSRCKSLGIDTSRSVPPPKPITVVYSCAVRIAEDRSPERQETRTTMPDWRCPLCELHGIFSVQQILNTHLQLDHSSVGFVWDMVDCTLSLRLPLPGYVPLSPQSCPIKTPSPTTTASREISDFSNTICSDEQNMTPETTQSPSRYTSVSSQPPRDTDLPDIKPKFYLLTPPRPGSAVSSRTLSRASSRTVGNTTPPPQSDPLGPSAQYPYLPESHSTGVYSCRLGGPRLYDLLNSMSLEPFGVLGWVILDREEEIFEIDNVRDEDKVMQALWFRWIFLNRNKFVANFFDGTKTFIIENWQMIHQAAGLAALRTWLLVLSINNFLVTSDVVALLRFYRGLTDVRHWYDDNRMARDEVAPV